VMRRYLEALVSPRGPLPTFLRGSTRCF